MLLFSSALDKTQMGYTGNHAHYPLNVIDPDENPTELLYFDLLPIDTICNLTRFLSSEPNGRNWPQGISSKQISSLYAINGEYGRFVFSRFDAIYLSRDASIFHVEESGVILESNRLAYTVLTTAGESFKTIHWDDTGTLDNSNLEDDIIEMSTLCPNLESFSFGYSNAEPWLLVFGERIKTLSFYYGVPPRIIEAVSSHCTNIRQLTLKEAWASYLNWSNLWEQVGNTLEKLELELLDEGEGELQKIENFCRKLEHVDIRSGTHSPVHGLGRCLASYGRQLEYTTISAMEYEELKIVVEQCTNARFDIEIDDYNYFDSLRLIGNQLEKVSIVSDFDGYIERNDGTSAWDMCSNVQEISLDDPTKIPEVEAIFNSPKLFLRAVSFDFDESTDLKKLMSVFEAGGIKTLESVEFVMLLPPPETFNKLVQMNQSLHKAEIYIKDAEDEEEDVLIERAIEITKCFLDSPSINFLSVQDYFDELFKEVPEVQEILRVEYRHRRVQAHIFGSKLP